MNSNDPIRIIILLMIKNESKIIRRSIDSTLHFADAILIEDTGSTDNTVEVIEEHFKTVKIPSKLTQHPWKNFGYSRSHSLDSVREFCKELQWDPMRTYALAMDADMNLVVGPQFNKQTLNLTGYQLVQRNNRLHYINIRLMRLGDPWCCVGATHEYWKPPEGHPVADIEERLIHIDDKDDGGCKADKYTRDLTLLQEELAQQPDNPRTNFYLAQTFKCLGKFEEAIKYYKQRIKIGGWFEEVWYSHYMIAQLYLRMNNVEKAELWTMRSHKYRPFRAEALIQLVRHLRQQKDDQWKAMHYLKQAMAIPRPRVALFIEEDCYDYHIEYEYSILQFYTNPNRKEGNIISIRYQLKDNAPFMDNVFSNLEFYIEPFSKRFQPQLLNAPDFDEFKASSPSTTFLPDGSMLMNIRYVNYETTKQGTYHPRDPEGIVKTRNAYLTCRHPFQRIETLSFIQDGHPEDLTVHPNRITGFEDVRVFTHNNKIYYTSSTTNYSPTYRIAFGEYDITTNKFKNNKILNPPSFTSAEKNWLAVTHKPELMFIYNWFPFKAGVIDPTTNDLKITIEHKTPQYFQRVRGSANPIPYMDRLYTLVHVVKFGQPRKYLHHIIGLDANTLKPLNISNAFAFEEIGIEYCLSMNIIENHVEFTYSHFDSNPKILKVPIADFLFTDLPM
jgi:glycosyltransferase involved in cell wall biosynthesis